MSKKKKILLGLGGVILLALIPIVMYLSQLFTAVSPLILPVPNSVVKDYVEEKYGFEVNILEKVSYGIGSPTEFTVSPKEEEHVRFTVSVDENDHSVIEDDYSLALETDKEYGKLKSVIPEIEKLGFTGIDGAPIRLDYIEDSAFLYLESEKVIDYDTFVKEDYDTYYDLYKWVKKSEAKIENVSVFGAFHENGVQNDISFYLEAPEKERTKDELLTAIKTGHVDISEQEIQKRLADEVKQLNNERFHLGNQYDDTHNDPFDSWLSCDTTNKQGECSSAVLSVTYQKNSFNAENPHLTKDVASILKFVVTHLEPEIKINYIYLEGSDLSGEEVAISDEERMSFKDTNELVEYILKK